MSFLSRLMGRDPDQIFARAQLHIVSGRFNEARLDLQELNHPDAAGLLAEANAALATLNLEEARARYSAGDPEGGREHMELAQHFGANPDDLRAIRRTARLGREARAYAKAKKAAQPIEPEGSDPIWNLPPDDPRIRFALAVEAYPDSLRPRMLDLGRDFASAVLGIEDGNPQQARNTLTPFAQQDPVARYERARAALQAGELPAAASDLATFGQEVGHCRIGQVHTAVVHAQVLAQLNRGEEALEMLDNEFAEQGELAVGTARASLLEVLGRTQEAEQAAVRLLEAAPNQLGMVKLLARARLALGERMGAMAALDAGLTRCCSSPGKCGNQPFDAQAGRMLVTLYLEDQLEPRRTRELLDQLAKAAAKPTWEDGYISALVARNDGHAQAEPMARQLVADLAEDDPRALRVQRAFGFPQAVA